MRGLARIVVFIMIELLILFPAASIANAQDAATIAADDIHDCCTYEDYVVEGVVVSVKWEEIPYKDFFHNVTHPHLLTKKQKFGVFEFEVKKGLIGRLKSSKITLYAVNSYENRLSDIEKGDEYIFSLCSHIYKGEVYGIMGVRDCRFLIQGDTFLRGFKNQPIHSGRVSDLYKAIEKIKEKRSLGTIIDEAELIVRGTVTDRWTTGDTLSIGLLKNIESIKLSVDECLKGDYTGDEIEFSAIYMATYNPFWKSRVPELNPGEEWLVFLKWAEEPGYHPFAGVNGMFEVDGGKLIRVNRGSRITIDQSLKEMRTLISHKVSRDDKDSE